MLKLIEKSLDIKSATILIVDDDMINLTVIQSLVSEHYNTVTATSGEEALEICRKIQPDLILLDVIMQGISGLDVCTKLKKDEQVNHIPVMFITSIKDQNDQNKCWDAGAVDFVEKPINGITLLKRIKVHLTIKLQTDLLTKMSYLDGLTGLSNRYFLDDVLEKGILQTNELKESVAILMIDIDWFKQYNDIYGHQKGDECLKKVAKNILEIFNKPNDEVIRYGGEEILCILPNTNLTKAEELSNQLLSSLANKGIYHTGSPIGIVTVSIGIAMVNNSNSTNKTNIELINFADKALYKAKQKGRNCYVVELA